MADSADIGTGSFEEFLQRCAADYEQAEREVQEVDLLIQQTAAEVGRLAQRNTQVTNRLRQIESSLDTVPREDIQEGYTAVLETQQRLFTMRGQLEKLQGNQATMASHLELLRDLLKVADRADFRPQPSGGGEMTQPLVVRIIEAQERERQQLSRQMHDGPAQSLTNLILQAEICERLFDTQPERARTELANLKQAVAATFQKVRGFILNLRPMMLDDLGVVPTLRRFVDTFSDNSAVTTDLKVTGKERRLPSHKEVTVFRIVQALLNNAVEFGQASSIQINLDMGDDLIRASVEDNGSGYELTEALNTPDAERLGLATMRERVEMLGGQIHFDSDRRRGTKVSLELPVSLYEASQ
jgi:two-component system sensor histidine kinase DegS